MRTLTFLSLLQGGVFYTHSCVGEYTHLTQQIFAIFYRVISCYTSQPEQAKLFHRLYLACTLMGWVIFAAIITLSKMYIVFMFNPFWAMAVTIAVAGALGRITSLQAAPLIIHAFLGMKKSLGNAMQSFRNKTKEL